MLNRLIAGVIAGAAAAIVAALVSLPLESPDDLAFSSLTVTIAALVAGLAAGWLWGALAASPNRPMVYAGIGLAAFAAAAIAALALEAALERSATFIIPLAAIVVGVSWVVAPLIGLVGLRRPWLEAAAGIALVGALAVGIGLAGQGDEESGKLSLPDDTLAGTDVLRPADVEGVTFVVIPGESTLTYTVREKLAILPTESDAVGRTDQLNGSVRIDGGPTEVSVDMTTLASNQDRRDNYVRTRVFNEDPVVRFTVDDIGALPDTYTPGEMLTRSVSGTATVRGVERPLTFEVEARTDGQELQAVGRTDFTWSDFDINPPDIPGIVDVQDNVHIEVLIIARR